MREFLISFASAAAPARSGCGCASSSSTAPRPPRACAGGSGSSFAIYQSGFDPAWTEQQPGMLLVAELIREATEEKAEDFDMLLGTESYKWRFVSDAREVRTIAAVGAAHPARLALSAEAATRRLGRGLARSRSSAAPRARARAPFRADASGGRVA